MREKKEINIQIGEQIRQAREHAKLTQEQLAETVGVTAQYISDLERGMVGVSIATLKKLCIALKVTSDQILFAKPDGDKLAILIDKCAALPENQTLILSDIIDKFIEAVNTKE